LLLSIGIRPLIRQTSDKVRSSRSIPLSLNVKVASLPECHDTTAPEFCLGIGGHHPPLGVATKVILCRKGVKNKP
jgi:hypothetical protein